MMKGVKNMIKNKTAMFIGHGEIYKDIGLTVKREIIKLVEEGVDTFLNGGMGDFDMICANCVNSIKNIYPNIRQYLVIPYLTVKIKNKEKFDNIIYPDLEECYYKAAIPKRNEWMIKNSSYAVCYIEHEWGGAAKTYKKALKEKIKIINLYDME